MPGIIEKNTDYERAYYAHKCVNDLRDDNTLRKDYRSEILQTPVRLHMAGIYQTLAFYMSKIDKEHMALISQHLMHWIVNPYVELRTDFSVSNALRIWNENFVVVNEPKKIMLYQSRALAIASRLKQTTTQLIKKTGELQWID